MSLLLFALAARYIANLVPRYRIAEFRGPGVHHNFDDSDSGYDVDAERKGGKSFGLGGYKGRIIFLGDGTEVLTDSEDTEMFDNAEEDRDLESQVSKTTTASQESGGAAAAAAENGAGAGMPVPISKTESEFSKKLGATEKVNTDGKEGKTISALELDKAEAGGPNKGDTTSTTPGTQ